MLIPPDEPYEQICERCTRVFDWPETGGQPTRGDYAGVPLCPDCYLDEESRDGG